MYRIQFKLDKLQEELLDARLERKFLIRCSEERVREQIDAAESEDKLCAVVKKYGLCDIFVPSGLDISVQKELLHCIVTTIFKYPRMKSKLCFVGSQKGYLDTMNKFMNMDAGVMKTLGLQYIISEQSAKNIGKATIEYVTTNSFKERITENKLANAIDCCGFVDGIMMDEKDFSTRKLKGTILGIKHAMSSGWYSSDSNPIKSIIYHELGHSLDFLCDAGESAEIKAEFENRSTREITRELSEYGATDIDEFIAESFAEVYSSRNPRALAKRVVSIMDKRYQALFS